MTIDLPSELILRAQREAIARGITLTALIEAGLRRVVDESLGEELAPHAPSHVGDAKNSLMPGFSWERLSADVQAMDDVEHAQSVF